MNTSGPKILVVHHIDAEGPLHEVTSETFIRLEKTLGIKIKLQKSSKNLKRLQQGLVPGFDPSVSTEIMKILDPHLLECKRNWSELGEMLRRVTKRSFREQYKDSYGEGWVFNWHVMDHVGFSKNPRRRTLGYGRILERYKEILATPDSSNDRIYWHFHPVHFNRAAHIAATSYENSYPELHQILCRRLIDHRWFPQVNRAGFHTIRPDSNWFLEQWIPFDASNQSCDDVTSYTDTQNGRFGDWKGAPADWSVYHPDLYDWKKSGSANRVISRALNLASRLRQITADDIQVAVDSALRTQGPVYLGLVSHDFRELSWDVEHFWNAFQEVMQRQKEKLPFQHCNSISAFRTALNYSSALVQKNQIKFNVSLNRNVLSLDVVNGEPFGPQPYLAIRTRKGRYLHDNFDFGEFKKKYFYTFDVYSVELDELDQVAIATNDKYGNVAMKFLSFKKGQLVHQDEAHWNL